MPDQTDRPTPAELYEVLARANAAVGVHVSIRGVQPDFVRASPIQNHPGLGSLDLAGYGGQVNIAGPVAELRAVVQEADRQLARVEVEHRVDDLVADDTPEATS